MAKRNTLNTILRLEPILVSLTYDNYKDLIEQLSEGIKLYDSTTYDKLNRFVWLVDSQLGKMPTQSTLKVEFPDLTFDNVNVISSTDELLDYISLFVSQKRQQYISANFLSYADTVRSQGLSDEMVEDIYKMLALAEVDSDFEIVQDSFKDSYEGKVVSGGIPFLCPDIDERTGGISEGELCTILGASGSMKTTYSSNIAYNAVKQGKNVLYLSLEEQPIQLYSKWLSRASVDVGKPLKAADIVKHNLEEKDKQILFDTVEPYFRSLKGNLYIVGEQDLGNYSLTSFETKFKEIDKLAREQSGHGVDLLVVDHIQLIKFAVSGDDPTNTINMYVSFFRQQCLSWLHEKRSIAVILLSQANRDGLKYAQNHKGAYLAQHVAEASEIIRASSYIISVYTDAQMQLSSLLVIGCVKLRGAQLPEDPVNVYADGEYYQVGDGIVTDMGNYDVNELLDTTIENKKDYVEDDLFASGILEDL